MMRNLLLLFILWSAVANGWIHFGYYISKEPPPPFNQLSTLHDGVDEYASCGTATPTQYGIADHLTISIWFKTPDDKTGSEVLVNHSRSNGYRIQMDDNGLFRWVYIGGGGSVQRADSPTGQVTADAWTHIVVTRDGNTAGDVQFYINGSAVTTSVVIDSATLDASYGSGLMLGHLQGGGSEFKGNLDEITFWNDDMTAAEVTELYNFGNPFNPNTHSKNANLTTWYRHGDGDTFPTLTDNQGTDDCTLTNMESGDIEEDVP